MTQTFTAQVRNWSEKAKRNAPLVVSDAAQGVFADMSERQPSIKEIGTFEIGKVPVDKSFLIDSLFTDLNGSTVGTGSESYVAALAGFELGDTITFAFSAKYAPFVEYGTQNMPGRFFVREALNANGGWQGRIDISAAKFKD